VASESTSFAKYQILTQSGTAMLAQANQDPSLALKLLGG
jgi:flagellin